jgi:hypothetical protein
VLTPAGRLIRHRTATPDLPAAFAAQFSLSHGCWLLTYPLAGWLAAGAGVPVTAGVLGVIALAAAGAATVMWPRDAAPERAAVEAERSVIGAAGKAR